MDKERFDDYLSQGISLMTEQNYTKAKSAFETAVEIDPRAFDTYIHLGNACANLGQYDEAMDSFKKALLVNPKSAEALYSIANIHLLKDEKLKAVEYYNKAEEAGFKRAELYQILTGIFFEANDITQALRNISKAINAAPFDGELRLFKTRIYLAENKFEEALETLDEMQKIIPDAFEAYDLRAQIYCNLGKFEQALNVIEEGFSRFPNDPFIAFSKLKTLVNSNKDSEALAFIEDMKANGQYDQVLKGAATNESILYIRKQEIEKAIEVLTNANTALGNDADIVYLLLDIYGKTENYDKVLEYSELLTSLKPDVFYDCTAKYFHAHALDKLGKKTEAKKEYKFITSSFRKITIQIPSFYEGYIYRLLSHTYLGEFEKAHELADYIENLYPNRPDGHSFRYFIYKQQGDLERADHEKKLVKEIDPSFNL